MAKHITFKHRRLWRRDKPWSKLSSSYADKQFEQIFGHKHELNVMAKAWKVDEESKTKRYCCWKCDKPVVLELPESSYEILLMDEWSDEHLALVSSWKCPNCGAEFDKVDKSDNRTEQEKQDS